MDIDRVQAEWVLELFPADQIPEFAAQAMMQGFEGPNILELVSFHRPTRGEIRSTVFDGALREMGREPLTPELALRRLARPIAQGILRGRWTAFEGAGEILGLARHIRFEDYPGFLMTLSYELEDMEGIGLSKDREQSIVEIAWSLIEEDPVR